MIRKLIYKICVWGLDSLSINKMTKMEFQKLFRDILVKSDLEGVGTFDMYLTTSGGYFYKDSFISPYWINKIPLLLVYRKILDWEKYDIIISILNTIVLLDFHKYNCGNCTINDDYNKWSDCYRRIHMNYSRKTNIRFVFKNNIVIKIYSENNELLWDYKNSLLNELYQLFLDNSEKMRKV